MKGLVFILLAAIAVMSLASCGLQVSDANVARYNLEVAEQNFQVDRRVVFYNGITGEYILTIELR